MGLLILEAVGPKGEELAMRAGEITEIPVGYDAELKSATFDSDSLDGPELEGVVFDALGGLDSEWRTHLRVAE
jgi:hypothetical protein